MPLSHEKAQRKETRVARGKGSIKASAPVMMWFRQDLRLADNPALLAACASGQPVLPVYILDDDTPGAWKLGGASRWWLHMSLYALGEELSERGVPLVLRRGRAVDAIPALAAEIGAAAVVWNRCYEPFAVARDTHLKASLASAGFRAESHNANLLYEPWEVKSAGGTPFKVFTPFWKAALQAGAPAPHAPAPKKLEGATAPGEDLAAWRLTPTRPDWAAGLRGTWSPGEKGATARLDTFLDHGLPGYGSRRDRPDLDATSRLSPHLHWGELSPRQVWRAVEARVAVDPALRADADKFLSELGWREFASHLLFHSPSLPDENWRSEFDRFPWSPDETAITAWQRGKTGYPIVDAGMRELWATGFMHNRVRMIVASFLIKDLLVHWRRGEEWFWDTLVDADLANNAAGWQWVAGSGADAAPYFRVFNPVTQGQKHDPQGAYVRRWLPEIAALPDEYIHAPWTAPPEVLAGAGVVLGRTYPAPIVDHGAARARALEAYKQIGRQADA